MTERKWREEFGRKLRMVLDERNMTQADLANAIDISEVSVSRYMRGLRTPSCYIVSRFCEVLGLPDNYFSADTED